MGQDVGMGKMDLCKINSNHRKQNPRHFLWRDFGYFVSQKHVSREKEDTWTPQVKFSLVPIAGIACSMNTGFSN